LNILWIILGLIGLLIIYLTLDGENATTFGLQNDNFAQLVAMSMWGALIATAVIPRKGQFKEFARNAAIWIFIILGLSAGYIFRSELQDIASRVTAGLIPGSPRSITSLEGRERVILSKGEDNHFVARMQLNGQNVTLLVDTGATSTVLTQRDAERAGITLSSLAYTIPISTANGTNFAAPARLNTMELGTIRRDNIRILVSKPDVLAESLLGMNFLSTLSSFEFRGDELLLSD